MRKTNGDIVAATALLHVALAANDLNTVQPDYGKSAKSHKILNHRACLLGYKEIYTYYSSSHHYYS